MGKFLNRKPFCVVPPDGCVWGGCKNEEVVGVEEGVHCLLFTTVMKEVAGGGSGNKPGWRRPGPSLLAWLSGFAKKGCVDSSWILGCV